MLRVNPHPLALFSLVPKNKRAKQVLAHPCNQHLLSTVIGSQSALDVGHVRSRSGDRMTLATLGRDGDIFIEGAAIARIQCTFEIDIATNIVMFYDRSHSQTSQVFGEFATPFEVGRLRKLVVQQKLNTIIGMGGSGCNLVLFELKWHYDPVESIEKVKERESATFEEDPRLSRTIGEITVMPSRRETGIHTPEPCQPKIRYAKFDRLGSGAFSCVYKAIDVDLGRVMAVKILNRPSGNSGAERELLKRCLLREREMSNNSHVRNPLFL